MKIQLTQTDIDRCYEFAWRCAKNQQEIEFGQHDTQKRHHKEIARDNFIGKMAEVAFAQMLKNRYQLNVDLDFNYYPRGVWDQKDADLYGWRIDVKATKEGGKWMLIEWSKLQFRRKEDQLSHLYVMASVGLNHQDDTPKGWVDIVGGASIFKLSDHIDTTKILRKGSFLPNTKVSLQADNFGISFASLEHDWDKIMQHIKTHQPPSDMKMNRFIQNVLSNVS